MTGLEQMDLKLIKYYTAAYGVFVVGEYALGEKVAVPCTSGEVLWSYQAEKGLVLPTLRPWRKHGCRR